jgi:hypothetical protein
MKRRPAIREKTYLAMLSPEDRRRYRHVKQGARIVGFVLQFETKLGSEWLPVIRYDCAHGAAHKDLLDIRRRQEKHLLGVSDLREAIALADADIRQNWRQYKARFLAGRTRK